MSSLAFDTHQPAGTRTTNVDEEDEGDSVPKNKVVPKDGGEDLASG